MAIGVGVPFDFAPNHIRAGDREAMGSFFEVDGGKGATNFLDELREYLQRIGFGLPNLLKLVAEWNFVAQFEGVKGQALTEQASSEVEGMTDPTTIGDFDGLECRVLKPGQAVGDGHGFIEAAATYLSGLVGGGEIYDVETGSRLGAVVALDPDWGALHS